MFESREIKELNMLTDKLVRTILKSDQIRALIINAKKQWDLDELRSQGLTYPVIRDLFATAQAGIIVDVKLPDGSSFTIKPDPTVMSPEKREELERLRRHANSELF